MPKKYYFSVKNPAKKTKLILAETTHHAIALAMVQDGYLYKVKEYTVKKSK